ncbi:hypothetical protein M9H77_29549 [Catharanthus roseus]|uniref:Uncharacterized protein n=1 Tax=Catharanthus roseus TaxID=4058 RepID=A0ACB9ZUQ9_CATRO|nr:hypothetical protein M9H77_29549 [Catharanthus roseus]
MHYSNILALTSESSVYPTVCGRPSTNIPYLDRSLPGTVGSGSTVDVFEKSIPTTDGSPDPIIAGKLLMETAVKSSAYHHLSIAGLTMSMDGHLPTQSHQEGTSDPTRMNLNVDTKEGNKLEVEEAEV